MPHVRLTNAEQRILRGLVAGLTTTQLAQQAGCAEGTVRWHFHQLRERTECASTFTLARWALEHEECCLSAA